MQLQQWRRLLAARVAALTVVVQMPCSKTRRGPWGLVKQQQQGEQWGAAATPGC